MNIIQDADFLSVFVTICALIFAVMELRYKTDGKKSKKLANLYSKIHFACQQLNSDVSSVKKLAESVDGFSQEELESYAESYLKEDRLTEVLQEIMDIALPCFDLKNEIERVEAVQRIFEFCDRARSLSASVFAFYQSIFRGSHPDKDKIEKIYMRLKVSLQDMSMNSVESVVSDQLKQFHKNKLPFFMRWASWCVITFCGLELLLYISSIISCK